PNDVRPRCHIGRPAGGGLNKAANLRHPFWSAVVVQKSKPSHRPPPTVRPLFESIRELWPLAPAVVTFRLSTSAPEKKQELQRYSTKAIQGPLGRSAPVNRGLPSLSS